MPSALAQPSSELEKRTVQPEAAPASFLGLGIFIKGSIFSRQDLYIDGQVEGTIEAAGSTLTVGPNASLTASVRAQRIVIAGKVCGAVCAVESVELRNTCTLLGDVTTSRISIEDGAYFKGSIDIPKVR
jgi:cytoskeletal protein CcmA (bactofilin family)